jgi:hypothetical protein
MRAHAGEQGVDGLLDRAADIDRIHLDLPAQVRELQHRHHAVDGHDGDAVHQRLPGRGSSGYVASPSMSDMASPESSTAALTA